MPLQHDAKIDRIHQTPLFRRADRKALHDLAHVLDEVDVAAGQAVITQGHQHRESYIIERGTLGVFVDDDEVAEIPTGEMVGEIALLAPGPATATVRTKSDATLLVIPHNAFHQVLADAPDLYRHIATELAHRLRAMDAQHHG